MEGKIYSSNSIEKCLEQAALELNIPKEDLKYNILEDKKVFFKRTITIEVAIDNEINMDKNQNKDTFKNKSLGLAFVKDNKIIVKNPDKDERPAKIIPGENIILKIDGNIVNSETEIYENNLIEVEFNEDQAKRNLTIHISEDKMKAFIDIEYCPKYEYALADSKEENILKLKTEIKSEVYPPLFSEEEIKNELLKANVTYGVIGESIKKCTEDKKIINLLIAEGKLPLDDEEDTIDIKFESDKKNKFLEDKKGRIDYKNIGSVVAVKKGQVIAEKIEGKKGEDGINIKGEVKKHKTTKPMVFRASEGCELQGENKIVATKDGKPEVKNGTFLVRPIYEMISDVDLSTGNVKFLGDIVVHGNVKEGMKVEGDSSVSIDGNVEAAEIKAKGDISISGNIILSKVYGGGNDVLKLQYVDDLTALKNNLTSMIETIMEIKKFNLVKRETSDGELIKALIESKFKNIPKICSGILRDSMLQKEQDSEILHVMKDKLLGLAPINIKHFTELDDIIAIVNKKIEGLNSELSIPVNVVINYCQDSNISSSGDIYIKGKGEYISNIISNKGVYFEQEGSVARGGTVKAKNEVKCKIVGSSGGVATRICVEAQGHIWADVAYQNTIFVVGERELVLDIPSKNIHVYMDETYDVVIDRLKL